MGKNKKKLLFLLSGIIIIGIIGFFVFGEDLRKSISSESVNQLKTETTREAVTTHEATRNRIDDFIGALPKKFTHRDSAVKLTPTNGYFITTSILSNRGDRIVYSEISESILDITGNGDWWNWEHNIFVKNLETGDIRKIYSFGGDKTSWKDLFISEAKAGGCPITYFPIAWSKNDRKIILGWDNATSCGSGGAPPYGTTYTISSSGGEMEFLAREGSVFFDNYGKVIFADESAKTPPVGCGEGIETNQGKIVLQDIESGVETVLAEKPLSHYSSLSLSSKQRFLTYSVNEVKWTSNWECSEVDASIPEKKQTIKLSDFILPTKTSIINWRTYENRQYGFSFKYPTEFPAPEIGKNYVSFSVPQLDQLEKSATAISFEIKQYDPKNPIEDMGYEGSEWQVNHEKEKLSILSKNPGIYNGRIPSSILYRDKPYEVKLVDGNKARISYDWFQPAGTYSKITEIYRGENQLFIFSAGADLSDPSAKFKERPFTTTSTGQYRLDRLFRYFDLMLSTIKFSSGENNER